MLMRKTLIIFLAILSALNLDGQSRRKQKEQTPINLELSITDTLTNEYLDTLQIRKSTTINDYTMIGVQYGAGLSQVIWNPSTEQDWVFIPYNFGVTYTRYGKMFGYMPYFGFQAGIFYGQEGYQFKYDEKNDFIYRIEGAEKALIKVVEVPVMAHMHIDFWKMKIMFNLGCYAGYRLSIERFQLFDKDDYSILNEIRFEASRYSFKDTDNRWDYGIKGGIGFGLIFDPIEIHIMAAYKHSLSSLYEPDHYSPYYYRFAYPSNIVVSAGVHFQLTKRTGKTKPQLKKLAKEMVYGDSFSEGW